MELRLNDRFGAGAQFRFVTMDCRALEGSGKDGAVQFSDLFEVDPVTHLPVHGPDGWPLPKMPERVTECVTTKNKFTKRGLSAMLDQVLTGHNGGPYVPSDISYANTRNPFQSLFLATDSPTGDGKVGDSRVMWDESDGQFDTRISANTANVAEGRRCVLLSDTAGVFKRLSIAYRSTEPYGEAEFVFFAQPNSYVAATGSITCDTQANHTDGETFTLNDGIHTAVVFEFDKTGDGVTTGREPVDISAAVSADDVRDAVVAAINRCEDTVIDILATASVSTGQLTLTHERGGAIGNKTITHTVLAAGWSVTGMTGGSSSYETGVKGLDNFPIKTIGLAYGLLCGDGETESQVGVRAISGLAPTLQGITDRVYCHEGKDLTKYTHGDLTTTISGDGYLVTAEATEAQIVAITGSASDTMNSSTKRIVLNKAYFAFKSHVRKTLRISGSTVTQNNKDYTIKQVISHTEVEVFETIFSTVTENFMTGSDGLYTKYTGDKAFDGRVENEGRVGSNDGDAPGTIILGEKWISADSSGPHVLGRIWSTTKTLTGIRVTIPAGTNKDFVPNTFKVDILSPTANGNNPRPGNDLDWVNLLDYSSSGQATNIYDAGVYGKEYTFSATAAKGVRLSNMQANSSSRKVEVAVLYAFEAMSTVSFTYGVDKLRLAVDGVPNYKVFSLPSMTATASVSSITPYLNQVLRGFQLEAVRSTFGYLWIRGTVAGGNSRVDLDTTANGSSANVKLGYLTSGATKIGITQEVRKWPGEALTILYRVNLTGNVQGGYA